MNYFYKFYVPTKIVYGIDAITKIGEMVKELGADKVVIITDEGVIKAGLMNKVTSILNHNLIEIIGIFDQIEPEPRIETVEKGVNYFQNKDFDAIIGVGGGSVMDTTKCINLLISKQGKLLDYSKYGSITGPLIPSILIPTTAGTGSEVSFFAIIKNQNQKLKMAFISRHLAPDIAIIDPIMTMTMPPELTAYTGIDALTHAIEAFVSSGSQPISDLLALTAIRKINTNLKLIISNGNDIKIRSELTLGSLLAGIAFNNEAVGGLVHSMSHPLGGHYNIPHGVTNAILLPHVMRYNLTSNLLKFYEIAKVIGEDENIQFDKHTVALTGINSIEKLIHDLGIPHHLKELGVLEEDIPTLVNETLKDETISTNPKIPTKEDIFLLYKQAL